MKHLVTGIGVALLACSLLGCEGGEPALTTPTPAPEPPPDAKKLFEKPKTMPPINKKAFAPRPAPGGPETQRA